MLPEDIIKYNILNFLNAPEQHTFSLVNKDYRAFLSRSLQNNFFTYLRQGKLVGKDLRHKSRILKNYLQIDHNYQLNLTGVNLSGVDLSGVYLSACILKSINLKNSILDYSVMFDSDMSGSNLNSASIKNANLVGTCLEFSDLENADFTDSDLTYASLKGSNTENMFIVGAILYNTSI